jgi:hypothetical protein
MAKQLLFHQNQNTDPVPAELLTAWNENNYDLKIGEEIHEKVLRKENNNQNELDYVSFFTEE